MHGNTFVMDIQEKTLSDYQDVFQKHIKGNGDRIAELCKRTKLSTSTIYNYINGACPDFRKANDIMINGIQILKESGIETEIK